MPNAGTVTTHVDQPTTVATFSKDNLSMPMVSEARRAERVSRTALSQIEPLPEHTQPLRISEVPPGAEAVEAVAASRVASEAMPSTIFDLAASEPKRTLMDMIDRLYVLLLQAHHRFSEHNRSKEDKEKERFNAYTETITSNTKSGGFAKALIAGLSLGTSIFGNTFVSYVHGNAETDASRKDQKLIELLAGAVPGLTEYFPRSYEAASANASSKQSLSSTKLQKMMNDDQQFKTLVDQIRQQYQKVLQALEQAAGQR